MFDLMFIFFAFIVAYCAAMPASKTAVFVQSSHIERAASPTTASPAAEPTVQINSISQQYITIDGVTNSYVNIAPQTITLNVPTCIQTITPDANGYVPPGTCGALWDYYPNFAAALLFAVLFATLTVIHIWQAARYKKVSTIMAVGGPIKG